MEILPFLCYNGVNLNYPEGTMELGEKIRQARLDARLSQRQLCGDVITRNMLSQIESGKAKPSMATLQYLAGQLGRPVGYFLDEEVARSSNIDIMAEARQAYAAGNHAAVLSKLEQYQQPDELFDQEYFYLSALAALALGEEKLEQGDALAAVPLLEQIHRSSIYYRQDMERQRRHLLSRGYEALEQYYKEREDYQNAYFYACKRRT